MKLLPMVSLLALGCAGAAPPGRMALEEEGAAYVYVQPPDDAARHATLSVLALAAESETGEQVPLELAASRLRARDSRGQRLLASGNLPPGRYAGFAITASAAAEPTEPPPAAGEPLRVSFPFLVNRRRAVSVLLRLEASEPIEPGAVFVPTLSLRAPESPAAGLIALVSSRSANVVTLLDKSNGRLVGVVPTGRAPGGIAIDRGRLRAFVALAGEDAVDVLDLREEAVIDRLRLASGDAPSELALTTDGRLLLTANSGSATVSVIDPISLLETERLPVGNGPAAVVLARGGTRGYVLNELSDSVTALELAAGRTPSVVASVPVEPAPFRAQLDRRGERLFVIHRNSPQLTVVDTRTLSAERRVWIGFGATAIRVDSQSDRIYIARRDARVIDIYDPLSLLPVDGVAAHGPVAHLAIDGDSGRLFVLGEDPRWLRIVALPGKQVVGELEVPSDPFAVAMVGER